MAIAQLRKGQIGKEATRGTAVAATKLLAGALSVELEDEWHMPEDTLGRLSKYQVAQLIHKQIALKYSGPAYFEQLLWWLSMGVKGGVAGVQQALTLAYLWTYSPNLTAGNVPDTYTIEYGDEQQAWETEYCFARSLTLSGAGREAWKAELDIVGRQLTETTFTGALELATGLEAPIFNKTLFYINPTWATLGTTVKAATLTSCSLTIPGFAALSMADGADYFSSYGDQGRAITGRMTLVYNTIGDVEFDSYRAGTTRFVRLICLGSLIDTGHWKTLQIDMAIKYTKFTPLGEWEGQTVAEAEFVSVYDVTGAKEFEIIVKNALSAIP